MAASIVHRGEKRHFGGRDSPHPITITGPIILHPKDTCSSEGLSFSHLMERKFREGTHYLVAFAELSHGSFHLYDALEVLKKTREAKKTGDKEVSLFGGVSVADILDVHYYAIRRLSREDQPQSLLLESQNHLARIKHHSHDEYDGTLLDALTEGELEGNPRALYALSSHYLGKKEHTLRMHYLERAAAVPLPPVQGVAAQEGASPFVLPRYFLALTLEDRGKATQSRLERARQLFKEVSLYGDPQDHRTVESLYRYGMMQLRGKGGEKDPRGALTSFEGAAEQGHAEAAREAGLLLKNKSFAWHNPEHSVRFLLQAAKKMDPSLYPSLSVDIARAYSGMERFAEAEKWFQKAMDNGDIGARNELEAMRRIRDKLPFPSLEGKSEKEMRAALLW